MPTDAIRPPARDVTGGEDLGDVGASLGVDDDTVVDPQAGCGGRRHVGFDADADHDQIPGHGAGIGEFDQDTVGGGADRLDRSAGAQVDTVAAVQVGAHVAHLGTEDGAQRYRSSLDDGDVDTQGARGGREFQPDEAGAHDHESPTGSQRALQALGVVEGAQVVHELRARPGNRNRAGTPAGGEQDRVGDDRCLPVEFDATRRRVDPHDGGSGHDFDVVAVQPLLR